MRNRTAALARGALALALASTSLAAGPPRLDPCPPDRRAGPGLDRRPHHRGGHDLLSDPVGGTSGSRDRLPIVVRPFG